MSDKNILYEPRCVCYIILWALIKFVSHFSVQQWKVVRKWILKLIEPFLMSGNESMCTLYYMARGALNEKLLFHINCVRVKMHDVSVLIIAYVQTFRRLWNVVWIFKMSCLIEKKVKGRRRCRTQCVCM